LPGLIPGHFLSGEVGSLFAKKVVVSLPEALAAQGYV
jgi:hypothetical protein